MPWEGESQSVDALGLTSEEAQRRLAEYGPNAVSEQHRPAWRDFLAKFWAPVPWMLETVIVLQLSLGKLSESIVIAILLVVNAVLSFVQESRANRALTLLKNRLVVHARVLRDGRWQRVPARALVPGDVIHLRLGDLAPADVRIDEGEVQLDNSALTGESFPLEAGPGATAYAGSVVTRGEATGEVIATAGRTYFGRTAELLRTAKTVSHLQQIIFAIVKNLIVLDGALVVALLIYAVVAGVPLIQVIPFGLILLVASVPVALPATFTLATAFGARELARQGVLVTRLSAIEEAAAMDVLASDKTGTITENRLTLAALSPLSPHTEDELLQFAAMACDEATQDPIDLAILAAAKERRMDTHTSARLQFIPFDPHSKRSEALFKQDGATQRVVKGAAQAIAALCSHMVRMDEESEALAAKGNRVLAVASGPADALEFIGLIALQDPPRSDSQDLIAELQAHGVRVIMVTGDGAATARTIASQVGVGDRVCPPEMWETLRAKGPRAGRQLLKFDVFARVLPEDKFRLVRALQDAGHVVGMTGDGVNDAPALKQAEVGIAVASATDVAKASASLVLTNPGLIDVLRAVAVSRRIYQRMLTYTLNKIIKTFEIAVFLSLGLMITGIFVVTPLLVVLLLFANDFVTMSIASDRVAGSRRPDRWRIATLVRTSAILAGFILLLSFAVFFAARAWLHLSVPQLQTLIFLMLVFSGQGTVYLVRERRHFWHSMPSPWLLLASIADIAVVGLLATHGVLMAAISAQLVIALFFVVAIYLIALDYVKVKIFRRFEIR